MDYFLVVPEEDGILLGTQSFGWFYPETGFDLLAEMVEKEPNLIRHIKIITDLGMVLTIEEFLRIFDAESGIRIRRKT
jgi:hypothetical protein